VRGARAWNEKVKTDRSSAQQPGAGGQERGRHDGPRGEHPHMEADLARTVMLLETVARVERNVAQTLRAMATLNEGEFSARRLRLAEEAIRGAHAAIERSERLQSQAHRWHTHVEVVKLQHALHRAGGLLTDLAHAERDIADILTALASEDGTELSGQRQQLARQAMEAAQRAGDRAYALRELAETAAGGTGNTGAGPAGKDAGQHTYARTRRCGRAGVPAV
jgi:hypothetical protein